MSIEATASFTTHANYLRAASHLAGMTFGTFEKRLEVLASRVATAPGMSDPGIPCDLNQVHRSLTHAWGTELLLALSGSMGFDDELVRVANNWTVVQTYYVMYHSTQALAVAKGNPRPTNHQKTQNLYSTLWISRPGCPRPWSMAHGPTGGLNCSKSIYPAIHPWTSCDPGTAQSLMMKAFETTRREALRDATARKRVGKQKLKRQAWEADEQSRALQGRKPRKVPDFALPNLTAAEKSSVNASVKSYGLIHYLYRLRIKTNYVDSSMFIDGPSDDTSSTFVNRDLCYLASSTMLLHELHIAQLIGRVRMRKWADDWLASIAIRGARPVGLALRRSLL